MFEHILVPLDGSTRAEAALPIAARIARAAGSSVVLLQVVSIPMNYPIFGYDSVLSRDYSSLITEEDREKEQADATAYLTLIAHSDLFAGITTTTEVVFGRPAPHILTLAEQAINLIVLCTHGQAGFLRWALGSVTERVLEAATVPMIVVRPPQGVSDT